MNTNALLPSPRKGVPYVPDIPVEEPAGRGVLFAEDDDRCVDGFDDFPYLWVVGGQVEVKIDLYHWSGAEEIKEQEHECRYEPVSRGVMANLWNGLRVQLFRLFPVSGVHNYRLPRLHCDGRRNRNTHGRERGIKTGVG